MCRKPLHRLRGFVESEGLLFPRYEALDGTLHTDCRSWLAIKAASEPAFLNSALNRSYQCEFSDGALERWPASIPAAAG